MNLTAMLLAIGNVVSRRRALRVVGATGHDKDGPRGASLCLHTRVAITVPPLKIGDAMTAPYSVLGEQQSTWSYN
jgi:hypothetical protein